jgi:hypothetical protein
MVSQSGDPRIEEIRQRFLARVRQEADCWIWLGPQNSSGYGSFARQMAHRASHELFIGPIPEGLVVDHLCSNRMCVNPKHLEAVTHTINLRRSANPLNPSTLPTHCPLGHEFTPENTKIRDRGKARQCRICRRRLWREYKARRRERERVA